MALTGWQYYGYGDLRIGLFPWQLYGQAEAYILNAYTLTAGTGTFTVSGQAAGLYAGRKVTASTGTFTLTGVAAGTLAARYLSAGTGTFILSGQAVGLFRPSGMVASVGTFVLTGKAATLTVGGQSSTVSGPTIVRYAQLGQAGACKAQLG